MSAHGLARRPAHSFCVPPTRPSRLGLAALLLFMLPAAAGAHTPVLRSGRPVTTPGEFMVTPAAVTYEASPGFRVTVWPSNVGVAATGKADGGPAGSFAGRIRWGQEGASGAPARAPEAGKVRRGAGRVVITNRDLEPLQRKREAQEEEYERTRRGRGMPSKQELQRRIEEQDRRLRELARQMREERREAELEALRSEVVSLRLRLSELSLHLSQQAATYAPAYEPPAYYPYVYTPPIQFVPVFPFGRHRGLGRGVFGHHPHVRPWAHHPRPARPLHRPSAPPVGRGRFRGR